MIYKIIYTYRMNNYSKMYCTFIKATPGFDFKQVINQNLLIENFSFKDDLFTGIVNSVFTRNFLHIKTL